MLLVIQRLRRQALPLESILPNKTWMGIWLHTEYLDQEAMLRRLQGQL